MKHIFTTFKQIITKPLLVACALLAMSGNAWGNNSDYYSKRTAKVANTGLGVVYVSANGDQNTNKGQGTETAEFSTKKNASSAPQYTYTFTATANDGYYCTGWYTAKTGGSTISTDNPYKESGVQANTTESKASATYYARFAAIPVSSAGTASTISFNHPDTKTVTLSFAATGADAKADFNTPTITANKVWTIDSWSWNTSTKKVDVVCKFVATSDVAAGTYEATVTLKSKGNLSNTGKVVASVDLTPTLTYKNGTVDISVSDADKTTLDLNTLRTAYQGADGVAGDGTITYSLKTANSNVSLTSAGVFYAKAEGTYTIIASATKNRYYAKTAEFTVTVGKRTPTVEWKEFEHIYSGNTLTDVATIKYNGKTVSGLGLTLTSLNTDVMTVDGNTLHAQILATQQDVTIQATTEGTSCYNSVTPTYTYTVEAKQTPVFKLNGKTIVAADTTIYLKIGETANMAFENIDEANFSYPTTGAATYTHNSTNHTGVITASYYGNREIVFEQTGTSLIFAHKRTITIYVQKHPVTLAMTDALNNKTWFVDDVFEGDLYTINNPASGQPAQNEVTVTSSNPSVLKLVEGKWKAVGAGNATLTIEQESNDFWTGDTITKSIQVSKHTPIITWNAALNSSQPWAKVIEDPVSSSNTEFPFTITSSDPSKADYVNGKIEVYNGTGDVTFTLTQDGNYKWNSVTVTKTFTCYKPNDHVTFTLSSNNHSNFQESKSSSYVSWTNTGCDMGETKFLTLTEVRDLNAIYHFTGVPDTLTFVRTLDTYMNQLPGTYLCEVYESPDNQSNTWELAWQYNTRDENSGTQKVALKPTTRYIKFRYNGTLTAHYKNIKVTERKEIKADSEFDFTSGGIGDNPTVRAISVEWYNVRTCSVAITGTDAKYFKLGDGSETIYSHLDTYNDDEKITVKYLHDEIKKHTATLTITSVDGKSATITLKGETTKAVQEIIWNEDLIVDGKLLIAKDALYSDVATASSGLPVELYVADGETKLKVIDGETIQGLADGTTKLYARQEGNENKWAAVTDNMDVQITSKTVQSIVWNDPLSNIQYTGTAKNIPLTAASSEDASGTVLPITYTLDKDAQKFASVSGSTLTITGTGTGKITAKQAGNSTYVAVSASKTLTSYDPDQNCSQSNIALASTSYTLFMSDVEELGWDEEPEELSFTATVGSGSLIVTQWYDDEWHPVAYLSKASSKKYGPYSLDRKTRKIRFEAGIAVSINVTHSISNIKVTKARYLEIAENYMDFSTVQKGQTVKRQFTVNYSDASGVFEVKLKNPSEQFVVLTQTMGSDCGSTKQNEVIKVNCTGKSKGKENDTIIISNNSHSLCIPLEAVVTGLTQQIHWGFDDSEEIKTTDNIQLSATADSDTLPVTFSSKNESVAKIKKVGDNYYLDIIKDGDVEIVASQAGDDSWEPTEKSCIFHISKVTPVITKVPTVNEVVLPKQLKDCQLNNDAVVSVAGKLEWQSPATAVERFNTGYTVVFTPTNSNWYNTTTCTVVVPVAKDPQSITWTIPGEINDSIAIYCNASLTFNASASSTLNVSYTSSEEQIAYVDGTGKLIINRGGKVKITARQAGNETYAEAEPVEKIINILRVSPTIITLPEADTMKIGRNLSDATLTGGRVELGGQQVYGKFSWVDGNTTAMTVAGKFTKQIVFTPTEAGWYEPQYAELDVVVERYAPAITTMALTADDITYGTVLTGTTGLAGTIEATDTVKKPNVPVEGTYEWAEKADLYDVNTVTATAIFKPTNNLWYKEVEFEVPLHVNPATATIYAATTSLTIGQSLSAAELENATTGILGEIVSGTFTWGVGVDAAAMIEENSATEYAIHFTSGDANYLDGDGICTLTIIPGVVFEGVGGNSTWDNGNNWSGDVVPTADDRVIINADVVVTSNVEVTAMTINEGKTVTIADGATLTIGEGNSLNRETYGNIIVENGGALHLGSGEVKVNDFTLHAAAGDSEHPAKSGQVTQQTSLKPQNKAYFILELDPRGATDYGWYDFTVPFHVDVMTGVTCLDANQNWVNITNEVNYAVMNYNEVQRAQGNYPWKKFRGVMEPGQGYTITVDGKSNVYRFEMKAGTSFTNNENLSLQATEGYEARGWNAAGNGTMKHVKITDNSLKVQLYDHVQNAYDVIPAASYKFVVGAAYLLQTSTSTVLTLAAADDNDGLTLRAPKRELTDEEKTNLTVVLGHKGKLADRLFVTCSDYATNKYVIGEDISKLGTMTASRRGRMWVNAKGDNLCAIHTAYNTNEAIIPLQLFASQAGEYTIGLEHNEASDVYVLRDGVIVWNIAMGEYTFDLNAGTTGMYSLLIVRRVNSIATDVEQTDADDNKHGTDFVEKIIVNDQLFILRDGLLYDAQGKKVTTR